MNKFSEDTIDRILQKFTLYDLPQDTINEILTKFSLIHILHIRSVNKILKNNTDNFLKIKYTKIYKKPCPSDINIVIFELKAALLPPFRTEKSIFHYGDFGMPDDWDAPSNEIILNWTDILTFDEKKEVIDYVVEVKLDDEYSSELEKISNELDKLLKERNENYWFSNWFEHMKEENDIYLLLLNKIPDLLYILDVFYTGLKNNSDLDVLNEYGHFNNIKDILYDICFDIYKLYSRFIDKTIDDYSHYQVGDYFYYYHYRYSTRQYYGIAMVGYDIDKQKKIAIFDGEGDPLCELPTWLETQFNRICLDYDYPESEINILFGVDE